MPSRVNALPVGPFGPFGLLRSRPGDEAANVRLLFWRLFVQVLKRFWWRATAGPIDNDSASIPGLRRSFFRRALNGPGGWLLEALGLGQHRLPASPWKDFQLPRSTSHPLAMHDNVIATSPQGVSRRLEPSKLLASRGLLEPSALASSVTVTVPRRLGAGADVGSVDGKLSCDGGPAFSCGPGGSPEPPHVVSPSTSTCTSGFAQ